ncbi:MAG: hypothetical protein IIC87_05895 [Chloroflexi bacterium]|nr:hypothetical protein [Chloroflexota bacterium]
MVVHRGIVRPGSIVRPPAAADWLSKPTQAKVGLGLAAVGIMVAMIALIGAIVRATLIAADGSGDTTVLSYTAWTFGVSTAGIGAVKLGIALILWGVVRRLWIRVESTKVGLAKLVPVAEGKGDVASASADNPYMKVSVTEKAVRPYLLHRMAYALWLPMLLMGVMVVVIGLVFSFIEAAAGADGDMADFYTFSALSQGTEFLGEAFLLAGISFLLGSILGSLRQGGGEVQESLGVAVKTPIMPATGKLFVALMAMGLMLAMLQFVLYLIVAGIGDPDSIRAWFAWLGPLREAALGIMLSGIVLALATIGTKVLPFQFWRIQEMIRTGK